MFFCVNRRKAVWRSSSGNDGEHGLGGHVGGHDQRAGAVAGEDRRRSRSEKIPSQLFGLVDHRKVAVIGTRREPEDLGQRHVFGNQVDRAFGSMHIADVHLFQHIDHEVTLVGRAVDQAPGPALRRTSSGRKARRH